MKTSQYDQQRNLCIYDQRLLTTLRTLGEEYGPLGVALVAAEFTDKEVLINRLRAVVDNPPVA